MTQQPRERRLRALPEPEHRPRSGQRRLYGMPEKTIAPEPELRSKASDRPGIQRVNLVNMDYTLLITTMLLVLIGLVMVYSASYYVAATSPRFQHDMFGPIRSQIIAALTGLAGLIVMANFNYSNRLRRFTIVAYAAALLLLIYTVFFGDEAGGATRWVTLPVVGRFQPSELAKLALVMLIAHFISANKKMADTYKGIAILGVFIGIFAAIIGFGTNNMSSAIIVAIIGFGIIFIASSKTIPFILAGAGGAIGLGVILATGVGFRAGRFAAWLDPFADPTDTGFQIVQSLFAIGSGGMFGLGLGQSRQKLGFIPEAHNDIIFSVICEELGFVGASLVLFLFGVYLWRAIKIALGAKDLYGCLLATGIALMVGSQALINIAVVTNSIPNTGVPLPFISHGGTSLLVLMTATGILLNISRYQNKE